MINLQRSRYTPSFYLFIKGVPSAESSRSVRGLGKGISGKPYPRLCNARRPRLEPGTFRSQAARLYRLHQARPSKQLATIKLTERTKFIWCINCHSEIIKEVSFIKASHSIITQYKGGKYNRHEQVGCVQSQMPETIPFSNKKKVGTDKWLLILVNHNLTIIRSKS